MFGTWNGGMLLILLLVVIAAFNWLKDIGPPGQHARHNTQNFLFLQPAPATPVPYEPRPAQPASLTCRSYGLHAHANIGTHKGGRLYSA